MLQNTVKWIVGKFWLQKSALIQPRTDRRKFHENAPKKRVALQEGTESTKGMGEDGGAPEERRRYSTEMKKFRRNFFISKIILITYHQATSGR